MRFRLRTLLILLAVLPPLLAAGWWKYLAWRAERERREALAAESIRLDKTRVLEFDPRQVPLEVSLPPENRSPLPVD